MRFSSLTAFVAATLLLFSLPVSAGPLDDYYLQQFGETGNIQLQKAVLAVTPEVQQPAKCGMPLKHGLRRDWNLLETSTQKILAKQLALQGLTGTELTRISTGGHFRIHYTNSGTDAPDIATINKYTGLGLSTIDQWVVKVGDEFENTYRFYLNQGYHQPPTFPYDVYLNTPTVYGKLAYGVTSSLDFVPSSGFLNAAGSYIEINKDFTDPIFSPRTYTPLQSLQITAAHEYHHAIQYGYNYFFDLWYAEATATWMEDEVYDTVNQLYNYIPSWFSNSTEPLDLSVGAGTASGGDSYSRWILNRYLSEKHGTAMVRSVWERVAGLSSPGGSADIPMLPVLEDVISSYGSSLSVDFFAFAKRIYTRDWVDHSYDTGRIHDYVPVASFNVYPATSTSSTLTPTVSLPLYSFAYYNFTPTVGATSLKITITRDSGIKTALFKNGSETAPDANGTSYTVSGLGTSDMVVLLIVNASTAANLKAGFSTDGKIVLTSGTASPPVQTSSATSCFIATAAYGSYLHPQVQLLRNFRDDYLLTSAPGRSFVAFYYRHSPPLANFIARHTIVRSITRAFLAPFIMAVAHPVISLVSISFSIISALTVLLYRIKTGVNRTMPAHAGPFQIK
jgi:hypothetical protein